MFRWLLLIVAALVFVAFAASNWTPVTMVFGAKLVTVALPVLVLAAALAGFVPMWLAHRVARRRWLPRGLGVAGPAAPVAAVRPAVLDQAQPTVVPPGCG